MATKTGLLFLCVFMLQVFVLVHNIIVKFLVCLVLIFGKQTVQCTGCALFKEITVLDSVASFCRVDKCRFFDSKMRPLLLVYDNEDISLRLSQNQEPSPYTEIKIIFKSGDG